MGPTANPLDDPPDAAALAAYATALAAAIDDALPAWVERAVRQRWVAWAGEEPPAGIAARSRVAAERARAELMPVLAALLAADVDAQRSNPLAVIRRAVPYPTEVLIQAGVAPVHRDADAERLFPDDIYDLSPASFADLDLAVHDPGIEWGAAKAHVMLARRRGSATS